MACSKFEYVKKFEQHAALLPNTWIVIRLDGHSFHRFSKEQGFTKPNDTRALHLMNQSAAHVLKEFEDILLAYGQSDEYSFIFKKYSTLWGRREAKLCTNLTSLFTSYYVMHWKDYFDIELKYPPSFDARAVCYPSENNLRDYLSWRQADCHINNLYNTAFWSLVQDEQNPCTEREAHDLLKGTDSAAKNELLYTKFGINYAKLDPMLRKGTVIYWSKVQKTPDSKAKRELQTSYRDVIKNEFWNETGLLN